MFITITTDFISSVQKSSRSRNYITVLWHLTEVEKQWTRSIYKTAQRSRGTRALISSRFAHHIPTFGNTHHNNNLSAKKSVVSHLLSLKLQT